VSSVTLWFKSLLEGRAERQRRRTQPNPPLERLAERSTAGSRQLHAHRQQRQQTPVFRRNRFLGNRFGLLASSPADANNRQRTNKPPPLVVLVAVVGLADPFCSLPIPNSPHLPFRPLPPGSVPAHRKKENAHGPHRSEQPRLLQSGAPGTSAASRPIVSEPQSWDASDQVARHPPQARRTMRKRRFDTHHEKLPRSDPRGRQDMEK